MIKSVIHIGFPREHVYDVLSNFAAYREWLPGCTRSVIVASEGRMTDVDTTVEGMKNVTMEVRFEEDPGERVRFHMTKGTDLKTYFGEHRLLDAANGNGTVVVTEVEMDAGAMIPKFVWDRLARSVVEEMGAALGERVKAFSTGAVAGRSNRGEPKTRRRRILQIANTLSGPRIWYLGKVYRPKV